MDLKERRLKQLISQQELAEKIAVSSNYYSMIETGKRKPSVKTAKKIAEVLQFDWTEFYEE